MKIWPFWPKYKEKKEFPAKVAPRLGVKAGEEFQDQE